MAYKLVDTQENDEEKKIWQRVGSTLKNIYRYSTPVSFEILLRES